MPLQFRGILLALTWLLTSGQDPSLLSIVSKRPLCVIHDSMAPEAKLTETLLEATQALRFDFSINVYDVSWDSEEGAGSEGAELLSGTCGPCSERLVIARSESLHGWMMSLAAAWVPACLPPAVRSVLVLTDFMDGVEPSPCLRDGHAHCVLNNVVVKDSDGFKLLFDAIMSLSDSANAMVLDRMSQSLLALGLTPWKVHTSKMLETEADQGMLLRRIFSPPTDLGRLTLGPLKAPAAPSMWSSWQCHPAGMAEFDDPDTGRRDGSQEFCLLERVPCCTGTEFTYHTSSLESPNLPPARFVSQSHPNISIAVRPSQAPYVDVLPDCHLHVPVAYLWGHGWEANPAHLLHDAVHAPLPRAASPVCQAVWLVSTCVCLCCTITIYGSLLQLFPLFFGDGMERSTEESNRADRSLRMACTMEGIRIYPDRNFFGSPPVHRGLHIASVAPASPRSVLALLPGVLRRAGHRR
jgi:hypothetical protein